MTYLNGMTERFAVIAIGGNAILKKGQTADPFTQMANLREAVDNLLPALERYQTFALTHGNGPQVGNDLLRSYHAKHNIGLPELGLADCVANTQGRIGHWMRREMKNHPSFRAFPVACVMTHVYVDKNEFTPEEHTKGVGPWFPNTAEHREDWKDRGIIFRISEDGSEIRRVVPSPIPYRIEEFPVIARLMRQKIITICCGGGGIPVFDPYYDIRTPPENAERFQQCDVVIDKDRASSLLATELLEQLEGAEVEFVILMEAKGLYRDTRFRAEDFISEMTLDELNSFLENNDLQEGSIKPKLEAIRDFLESGGRVAYLGPLNNFKKVFDTTQRIGTRFVQTPQLRLYD